MRDRSALALIQYAALEKNPVGPIARYRAEAGEDAASALGRDVAATLQLYTAAVEELATLVSRSSSAKTPRGGTAATPAEELWGSGSWRMRLAALMYGGDPLAEDEVAAAWQHPLDTREDWPLIPFADGVYDSPQVHSFLSLLRQYEMLSTSTSFTLLGSGPPAPERAKYEAVELRLRRDLCRDGHDAQGDCVAELPTDEADYALWTDFGIRLEDATKAVSLLRDLVRSHRVRGTAATAAMGFLTTNHSFSPDSTFVARTGLELAANFTSLNDVSVTDILTGANPATFGAISTLAAFRHRLAQSLDQIDRGDVETVFGERKRLFGISGGYAGSTTTISPGSGSGSDSATVTVVPEERDPFWAEEQPAGTDWLIFGAPTVSRDSDVLLDLSTTVTKNNFSLGDSTVMSAGTLIAKATIAAILVDSGLDVRTLSGTIYGLPSELTLFAWRRTQQEAVDTANSVFACQASSAPSTCVPEVSGEVRLIARRVDLSAGEQYFGGPTGTLSIFLDSQLATDAWNPSLPAHDGFGNSPRWVPPLNAELLGATTGQPTFRYFLEAAERIAGEATTEVRSALAGLLDQELDESKIEADVARAVGEMRAAEQSLCGSENPECICDASDTTCGKILRSITVKDKSAAWVPALEDFEPLTGVTRSDCQNLERREFTQEDIANLANEIVPEWVEGYRDEHTQDEKWLFSIDLGGEDWSETEALAAVSSGDYAKRRLDCAVWELIDTIRDTRFKLAGPVEAALAIDEDPSFDGYTGGTLQTAFYEQWEVIATRDGKLRALYEQVRAAQLAINLSIVTLTRAGRAWDRAACGAEIWVESGIRALSGSAASAGIADLSTRYENHRLAEKLGDPSLEGGMGAGSWALYGAQAAATFMNSYNQLTAGCQAAEHGFEEEGYRLLTSSQETLGSALSLQAGAYAEARAIVMSGMWIQRLISATQIAQDKHQLEISLAGSDAVTSFGLYRRYHAYDLWRAKALLDTARQYALAARRGIEAYYVVDLDRLLGSEPLVGSPTRWAAEVYEYDLSLPGAIGLQVTTATDTVDGGIFADKLGSYVDNLRAFVDGFAIARPSAVVQEDIEVLSLPGLASPELPFDVKWHLLCENAVGVEGWALVDHEPICPEVDGIRPDPVAARVSFTLDPWGRVNSWGHGATPFEHRYNARWGRLAVNLVGAGLIECRNAVDVDVCKSRHYVPYRLTQGGVPWTTDYDGNWRILSVPPGVIEAGKAVADERFLNPLEQGWDTSYVSTVARTELLWRPLGGQYEIEFELGPEVVLDRLERVQLLVGTQYWTKQD